MAARGASKAFRAALAVALAIAGGSCSGATGSGGCDEPGDSYCHGAPLACSVRPMELCHGDCTPFELCMGKLPSCASITDPAGCAAVGGCSWNETSQQCTGIEESCSSYGEHDCPLPFCAWVARCEGTAPAACPGGGATACNAEPGCAWASSGGCQSPRCQGFATPCAALAGAGCEGASGCVAGGTCTGLPSATCPTITVEASCKAVSGCFWSTTNQQCTGVASGCSPNATEPACESLSGCDWEASCVGEAPACDALGQTACALQPGCVWL